MNDLISRQAAIDAVKEYFKFSPLEGRQCAKAIERVPSAQPRKGKWTRREDGMLPIICECSVCGFDTTNFELFSFCPNCGCRMEEGDAE